jgi:hypothetical protein
MLKSSVPKPDPYDDRLLSFVAVAKRWSCHPKIAQQRIHALAVPVVKFNARAHAVRLSDILRVEQEATTR